MKQMKTRIRKWGNGLAVRIPQALARRFKLEPGTRVKLSVRGVNLTISPVKSHGTEMDELLTRITQHNLPGEVDTGPAVGNEIW